MPELAMTGGPLKSQFHSRRSNSHTLLFKRGALISNERFAAGTRTVSGLLFRVFIRFRGFHSRGRLKDSKALNRVRTSRSNLMSSGALPGIVWLGPANTM